MSESTAASAYGLLSTGFAAMRLPEIRQEIHADLTRRTGKVFETRPDSFTGQFIDSFAEREARLWSLAELVYFAMYPVSSRGTSLDHAASFTGVRRLFAARSSVGAVLYGDEGTVVPAGSIARTEPGQIDFRLEEDVAITSSAVVDVTLEIAAVAAGATYTVILNSIAYSYVADVTPTGPEIAAGLAVALLTSGLAVSTDVAQIRIRAVDMLPFALSHSANVATVRRGSAGRLAADMFGPVEVSAGALTRIVTQVPGWASISNPAKGDVGRDLETDDELRLRYNRGVYRLGAATLDAIYANLREDLPEIGGLAVFENPEDTTDAHGRPPHSIEVVAEGGDPQEIAQAILRLKAAGIDTFGGIELAAADSQGMLHRVRFNRPERVWCWVKCVVTPYGEETFPGDGLARIRDSIVATGNALPIGADVIVQRFHGPIYREVRGVAELAISIAASIDPAHVPTPAEYLPANAAIGPRQVARFDASRCEVS